MSSPGAPSQLEPERALGSALSGDPVALRALVQGLMPTIHRRVAAALMRRRGAAFGTAQVDQEIGDLVQETFASLFADGAKALRAWDPGRGVPLVAFVGIIAEHQVASILRSGRRNPWSEQPTESEALDRIAEGAAPASAGTIDTVVASRDLLARLLERLRAELTPRGLELFEMMYVESLEVEEVCSRTAMTPDAVYAWRSRLSKLVRRLAGELDSESVSETGGPPRRVSGASR
jgi:RNA polymerase sigma-70 factor (ECF subfamily)